jgi:hypothetical protein
VPDGRGIARRSFGFNAVTDGTRVSPSSADRNAAKSDRVKSKDATTSPIPAEHDGAADATFS